MIESKYRQPYQRWIIAPILSSSLAALPPIALTLCAGVFGLLTCAFLLSSRSGLALICLIVSGFCDTLDGSLARHQNKASAFGAACDITMDRFVEFAVILGLYLYAPQTRSLGAILMLGGTLLCVTTFLVVSALTEQASEKSFYYSPGLIERAEAFFLFGLMILLPSAFGILSTAFALLTALTGALRLIDYRRQG